jgi:hypothetical protein
MRELWNSWYETLVSVEALAVVIVFAWWLLALLCWRIGGDKRVR